MSRLAEICLGWINPQIYEFLAQSLFPRVSSIPQHQTDELLDINRVWAIKRVRRHKPQPIVRVRDNSLDGVQHISTEFYDTWLDLPFELRAARAPEGDTSDQSGF